MNEYPADRDTISSGYLRELLEARTKRLYRHSIQAVTVSYAGALVLAFVVRDLVPDGPLWGWLGAVTGTTVVRILLAVVFSRLSNRNYRLWLWIMLVGAGLSGLLWGLGFVLFRPYLPLMHEWFILLMIGGFIAGSIPVLAVYLPCFTVFTVGAGLPVLAALATSGATIYWGAAALVSLFLGLQFSIALQHERGFTSFFRLEHENVHLARQIQESETKFRTLTESAASAIFILKDGKFVYMNPAVETISGYSQEELSGRPFWEVIHPDHREQTMENARRRLSGEDPNLEQRYEIKFLHKGGGVRWIDLTSTPFFHQGGPAILVSAFDVTRQKLARDEVELIFHHTQVGISYLRDGNESITKCNQQLADIFGYESPADMVGTTLRRHLADPAEADRLNREVRETEGREEAMYAEVEMRRCNGETCWCRLAGKVFRFRDSREGYGEIWVVEDITERRKLETLKEDVERITRHDLKMPLNAMIGLPQLLASDDNLTDEQRELLQELKDTAYKMLDMINLSLDLYKMETGSYELHPVEVDLVRLSRQVLRELRPLAAARNVRPVLLMGGEPPENGAVFPISGEELLCYSMLANLLKNGVEAAPSGSEVTVDLHREEGGSRIDIHNPGEVPEEMRGSMFEKYATSGKKDGTGLGGYSARLAAETHGGRIWFESGTGDGTTVSIFLPDTPL